MTSSGKQRHACGRAGEVFAQNTSELQELEADCLQNAGEGGDAHLLSASIRDWRCCWWLLDILHSSSSCSSLCCSSWHFSSCCLCWCSKKSTVSCLAESSSFRAFNKWERAKTSNNEQGTWLQMAGRRSKQKDSSPEGKSCDERVEIKDKKAVEDSAGETG